MVSSRGGADQAIGCKSAACGTTVRSSGISSVFQHGTVHSTGEDYVSQWVGCCTHMVVYQTPPMTRGHQQRKESPSVSIGFRR